MPCNVVVSSNDLNISDVRYIDSIHKHRAITQAEQKQTNIPIVNASGQHIYSLQFAQPRLRLLLLCVFLLLIDRFHINY